MGVWTDKKIEKLKILWEKGVPTAEIGKKLDFSKNAIVGKVHRLGLSNRNSPIKTSSLKSKKEVEKNVEKITSKVKEKNVIVSTKTAKNLEKSDLKNKLASVKSESQKISASQSKIQKKTISEGVSLYDLTSDRCCWPIDDVNSENFHFCGKKVFKSKPYCLEHCAIAYTNTAVQSENKETTE